MTQSGFVNPPFHRQESARFVQRRWNGACSPLAAPPPATRGGGVRKTQRTPRKTTVNTDTMIPNDRSATSRVASPQARLKRRRIVAALAAVWIPIGLARSAPIEAAAQTAPRSTPRDGDP